MTTLDNCEVVKKCKYCYISSKASPYEEVIGEIKFPDTTAYDRRNCAR